MKIAQLFFIVLTFCLFTSCENDIKTVASFSQKKVGVEEGYNIKSFMSTAGKVKAKLTAPYMLRQPLDSSKTEFPKSLNVIFYDSILKPESFLFAKYGKHLEYNNTVLLKDSIVMYNVKKDTLWCNDLLWNQNTGMFTTDKPVVFSQDNAGIRQKIFARGLESDQNFKKTNFLKAGIIYNPNKNSFIILRDSSTL
jgi:hypothetical protein